MGRCGQRSGECYAVELTHEGEGRKFPHQREQEKQNDRQGEGPVGLGGVGMVRGMVGESVEEGRLSACHLLGWSR
jgi:hypothetical protein